MMDTYEKKYKGALARCKWLLSNGMISKIAATDMFRELMDNSENIRKEIINIFHSLAEGKIPVDINYADIFTWLEKQGKKKYAWGEEDERIKKVLINLVKNNGTSYYIDKIHKDDILAWLEKQNKQKPNKPKFEIGNWVISTLPGIKYPHLITDIRDGYYIFGEEDDRAHIASNDDIFKLWTIDDAKDGDVLINWNNTTFIFKAIEDETVKFHIAYNEKWDAIKTPLTKLHHLGLSEPQFEFHPATKEQRNLLFRKMKETRYTFDFVKKELKKVEPKFKVGDWITFYGGEPFKILKVEPEQNGILDYLLLSQDGRDSYYNKNYVDTNARLWTIQDAKQGDVLYHKAENGIEYIVMNKGVNENNNVDSYFRYHSIDGFNTDIPSVLSAKCDSITPATKEQRDFLFQKMKEAGYEWDAEKKELNKIHVIDEGKAEMDYCFTKMMNGEKVSSAWSEEDENNINSIVSRLEVDISYWESRSKTRTNEDKKLIGWLKSLRPQNRWKPSDEQMFKSLKTLLNEASCYSCTEGVDKILAWLKQKIGR